MRVIKVAKRGLHSAVGTAARLSVVRRRRMHVRFGQEDSSGRLDSAGWRHVRFGFSSWTGCARAEALKAEMHRLLTLWYAIFGCARAEALRHLRLGSGGDGRGQSARFGSRAEMGGASHATERFLFGPLVRAGDATGDALNGVRYAEPGTLYSVTRRETPWQALAVH